MTMRAIVLHEHGGPEQARFEEAPDPVPAQGEVLVQVHAAPVNYVDLLVVSGGYQFLPKLPFVPGKGPAGIVVAGTAGLPAGTRVLAMAEQGGYAERVAVPAKNCFALPETMDFVQAASFSLVYDTSWFALRDRARAAAGETVLVLGASGGVGFASVQLARAMGCRVLAGIARMDKASLLREAGADAIIDLSAPDLRESLRAQVHDATGGQGVDVILDPVGGDVFDAALRALAWRGRLVVIGFAAGRIPSVKANYLLLKNIEVTGLQVSDYRKRRPDMMRRSYDELFGFWRDGKLAQAPVEVFPLSRAAEALARVRDRQAQGRVVLLPHEP
jgi:NADPH2:quinone reductase